jgi:hypothetical protein
VTTVGSSTGLSLDSACTVVSLFCCSKRFPVRTTVSDTLTLSIKRCCLNPTRYGEIKKKHKKTWVGSGYEVFGGGSVRKRKSTDMEKGRKKEKVTKEFENPRVLYKRNTQTNEVLTEAFPPVGRKKKSLEARPTSSGSVLRKEFQPASPSHYHCLYSTIHDLAGEICWRICFATIRY